MVETITKIPKLKPRKLGGYEFLVNSSIGYYPYFSTKIRARVAQKKINTLTVTGEAGIGKSYLLFDIFRVLSKFFSIDDIVFKFPEFLRCITTTPRGIPIAFDEPQYIVSNRDWYSDINKAISKTVQSFRFKGKPLGIPIINTQLLDSQIRDYLITFHIVVIDRGKARVYRKYPSQLRKGIYHYKLCELRYGLFDNNLCDKKSCLGCRKLDPGDRSKRCIIFRARYERKKIGTQEQRYKEALEDAERKEYSKLSTDEIEAKAIMYFDRYYDPDKNRINRNLLSIVLKRELKIIVGENKLYRIIAQIEYDHPEKFVEPTKIQKIKASEQG